MPDDDAERAKRTQSAQPLEHLIAAPADRVERSDVLREYAEHRACFVLDGVAEPGQRVRVERLGAEIRVVHIRSENRVQEPGHLPEPTSAGEELCGTARERFERELPAFPLLAHEMLEDPEGRRDPRPGVVVPAEQRRHVREAPRRHEMEHLELGARPAFESTVHLEYGLVAEDDRAVRLLGPDRAGLLRLDALGKLDGVKPEDAIHRLEAPGRAHRADELLGQRWRNRQVRTRGLRRAGACVEQLEELAAAIRKLDLEENPGSA